MSEPDSTGGAVVVRVDADYYGTTSFTFTFDTQWTVADNGRLNLRVENDGGKIIEVADFAPMQWLSVLRLPSGVRSS